MVSSSRPRSPSANSKTVIEAERTYPVRRSSLGGLLRRHKSGEFKMSKKQQALAELEQKRQEAAISRQPPILPSIYHGSAPTSLLSAADRPDSVAIISNKFRPSTDSTRAGVAMATNLQIPPLPSVPPFNAAKTGGWVDPYARTESMTHRGRYSYASTAVSTVNSPRRIRRRKDPTPFNILIIGTQASGKTSFLKFLETTLALPIKKRGPRPSDLHDDIFAPQRPKVGNFEAHYLETEIDGERIGLTLWDSEGLRENVVDLQLREMVSFLESKFEETFTEEMKVVRAPGVQDTHIHAVFLLLDPLRLDRNIAAARPAPSKANRNGVNGKHSSLPRIVGSLDEDLDLQVLRTLQRKTTVIPVISKADTITTAHMAYLKKTVWDGLRKANIDPLESLGLDDTEGEGLGNISGIDEGKVDSLAEDAKHVDVQNDDQQPQQEQDDDDDDDDDATTSGSTSSPTLPLSIISPDTYEPNVIGRKFPWGFADPMNEEHCDFVRLKEAVFSDWRGELREASREIWYEGWRTSRLNHREMSR